MAVTLSIYGGIGWQFFDGNGDPLAGGKLYTYEAGTTTPLASYTSNTGVTLHPNPIVLDSVGKVPGGEIWLTFLSKYKFVLRTSTDALLNTYDQVGGSFNASSVIQNFTGTGAQVAFIFSSAPANEDSTLVYINGVYQQKNTYTVVGTALTFSEAPPLTASIEVSYV